MKRKSLFNRIISLSIIATLYLSMSASAYAELDTEVPATEQVVTEDGLEDTGENAEEKAEKKAAADEIEKDSVDDALDAQLEPIEEKNIEKEDSEKDEDKEKNTSDDSKTLVEKMVEAIESVLPKPASEDEANEDVEKKDTEKQEEDKEKPDEDIKQGDTYFEIVTREDGTTVKATYEYILNEETGELEPILKEEQEGKFDEEGNLIEEEKKECEHELTYISNKDGTHKVKCNKCDLEEYTETCTYDENGVCIHCGFKRLPDPVLVYEDDEVIVRVSGAVPENADLKVTPIKRDLEETKDAFEQVEKRLVDETDIEEHDKYGFLAYDISFINIETKEEVEPSDEVKVTMEYKTAVAPIAIDPEIDATTEVEMIHFNEQSEQLENITETGKANLSLDESKAITQAEFSSNSFSTYVIAWLYSSNVKYVKVITSYYTKDNDELIEFSTDEVSIDLTGKSPGETNIKEKFERQIEGYRYLRAEYKYNDTNQVVDNFKYYRNGSTRAIKVCMGNTQIGSNINLSDTKDSAPKIYLALIYEKDAAVSITKKATGTAGSDPDTSYVFTLTKADGTPVTDAKYYIGKTRHTTDADGKFLLKTGESADFPLTSTPAGNYRISEDGVLGDVYSLDKFITKIYLDGELKETHDTDVEHRNFDFTITESECAHIVYKNHLITTKIDFSMPERLSKYIRYNGDEKYDLGLKFTPPGYDYTRTISNKEVTETERKTVVDIVLVVDKSGSMGNTSPKRITHLKEAVETLRDVMLTKRNVTASWKVVYFDTKVSGDTASSQWKTTDSLTISTATSGATNYEAALRRAQSIVQNKRAGTDKTIVIFLTDGEPTAYGDNGAGLHNSFDTTAYFQAKEAASKLTCDAFYSIGIDFKNTTYKFKDNDEAGTNVAFTPSQILDNVTNSATKVNDKMTATVKASEVAALLKGLVGTISSNPSGDDEKIEVKNRASNVTLTDTLSEYAEPVPGTDFYISIDVDGVDKWNDPAYVSSQQNGKIGDESNPNGTEAFFDVIDGGATYHLTAEYKESSKTVTLKFPPEYKVNPRYSYKVVFTEITPTDKAYTDFLASGYNATGEEGTDNVSVAPAKRTSEDKEGFRTNTRAYVKYDYMGEQGKEVDFNHPVLQVHIQNQWEIYKTDENGENGKRLRNASFKLTKEDTGETVTGSSVMEEGREGIVAWNLEENQTIEPGKYTLEETASPHGYVVSDDNWEITVDEYNVPTVVITAADGTKTTYEVEPERNKNIRTYRFYYKNLKMGDEYNLPETGGSGTFTITGFGLALMLTSAFLFYRNKRKTKTFTSTNN